MSFSKQAHEMDNDHGLFLEISEKNFGISRLTLIGYKMLFGLRLRLHLHTGAKKEGIFE